MPLEFKQPEKVLLLIKAFFTIFWFITVCAILCIVCLNIKQNLSYVDLLGPHTLGKLIFQNYFPKYQTEP